MVHGRVVPLPSSPLSAFGRAIRELRHTQGISQEELGYRSGLDRTYVGGIERGERNPTLCSILRLATGLEVPVSSIVERFERLLEEARTTPAS
jgi:transcriptional regulator with XRE-family HTH domain